MLVSLNWLREFVPYEGEAQALGDKLTMLGLELEQLIRPYANIASIVVGHVLECGKHPEADKLSVCLVDIGSGEPLPIVCGAPNVAAGQKVPVAPVGTIMPGGMAIKAATLRGQASHGMICSERELGLTEDHSGIMVLDADLRVGTRLVDALKLDTEVLEIGITPNRGDCLSILGMAREVALAFSLPLLLPAVPLDEQGADASSEWAISVAEAASCPLYLARLIDRVAVKPSPAHVRYRLNAMGVRPISNIVDATNYILLELGQPLHAFDRDKLEGGRIHVSAAQEGQRFTTLDGQERRLTAGDLLINDGAKAVALAGVMGGLNSEITDVSTQVLLESAVFHPISIRKTARRLGLSSEASYRFERGVDQGGSLYALNKASSLIAALSGGVVRRGVCGHEAQPFATPLVLFRPKRASAVVGIEFAPETCKHTLQALGCTIKGDQGEGWNMQMPSWRYDLRREIDLVEEVARVHGLADLPETLPAVRRPLESFGQPLSRYDFIGKVKQWGSGLGLNEAINYSFVGQQDLNRLELPQTDRIAIVNPLSEDQNVLRTCLAPGLLQSVGNNISHGVSGVRLFECAHVFAADAASETTARERMTLGLALYGARHNDLWPYGEADADYADLRGVVEHFLRAFGLSDYQFEACATHGYLLPAVRLIVEGQQAGILGCVKKAVAGHYNARKALWLAEIDLECVSALHSGRKPVFSPLPVYPASWRDITIVAKMDFSVANVLEYEAVRSTELLETVELVDVYAKEVYAKEVDAKEVDAKEVDAKEVDAKEVDAKEVDAKEKKKIRSSTFRFTFRHPERTLKDSEVDEILNNFMGKLTLSYKGKILAFSGGIAEFVLNAQKDAGARSQSNR